MLRTADEAEQEVRDRYQTLRLRRDLLWGELADATGVRIEDYAVLRTEAPHWHKRFLDAWRSLPSAAPRAYLESGIRIARTLVALRDAADADRDEIIAEYATTAKLAHLAQP